MRPRTPAQKDATRHTSRQQKLRAEHRALGFAGVEKSLRNARMAADIARTNYLRARNAKDPELGAVAVRAMEAIRQAEYWDEVHDAFLDIKWKQESHARRHVQRRLRGRSGLADKAGGEGRGIRGEDAAMTTTDKARDVEGPNQ